MEIIGPMELNSNGWVFKESALDLNIIWSSKCIDM